MSAKVDRYSGCMSELHLRIGRQQETLGNIGVRPITGYAITDFLLCLFDYRDSGFAPRAALLSKGSA